VTAADPVVPLGRVIAGAVLLAAVAAGVAIDLTRAPTPLPAAEPPPAPKPPAVVRDTRAALTAWAAFASTADLSALTPSFAPGGPQLRQLRSEAPNLVPTAPRYRFELTEPVVLPSVDPQRQVVRGTVVLWRDARRFDRQRWDIEMRRYSGGDRWRLWTVRALPSAAHQAP
jgi:hypothetical protein